MELVRVDDHLVFSILKERRKDVHKGDFGRLLNIAGSESYYGAAVLSSRAAYAAGCGYVYSASTEKINELVISAVPEAVCINTDSDPLKKIRAAYQHITAVSYGCGVGDAEDTELLEYLLGGEKPLVIDADGLNRLSRRMDLLQKKKCPVILTPHPGEFERLSGIRTKGLSMEEKAREAQKVADSYDCTLILKGSSSLIVSAGSETVHFVDNGSPGMAKAGSGDALTGIVGSLLAQSADAQAAAYCGAWLHAEAGSMAARDCSITAMRASDLIDHMKDVFLKYGR